MAFWENLLRQLVIDDLIYLIDNTYYLKIHKTTDGYYDYALYDLDRQLLQDGHLDQAQSDHILDAGSRICHLLDFSAAQLEMIPPTVWERGSVEVCYEA